MLPLPPEPPLKLDNQMIKNHEQATLELARLDGLAYMLANTDRHTERNNR